MPAHVPPIAVLAVWWYGSPSEWFSVLFMRVKHTSEVVLEKQSHCREPGSWGMLMNLAPGFFFLDDSMGVDTDHRILVYGGDEHFETRHGRILRLQDLAELVD